jgi:ketosteroid isomerase-like protein
MNDARRRFTAASLGALFVGATAPLFAPAIRAHDADEAVLGSLVDAELAFARMAAEQGVRAAFLANFASDGIVFEPGPVRLHDAWSARPAPADPLAVRLEWAPAQAGIARSHDIGYTTGPYTTWRAAEPQRKRRGVFFSVWRRDARRRWAVALDAGNVTPGPVDFAALGPAPRTRFRGARGAALERRRLLAQEANAFAAGPKGLAPAGYARLLADDARLYRDGSPPLASRGLVARAIAQRIRRVTWAPIDARVSAAGDMAFSYGRCRETDRAENARDGYYAHLWLRDAAGAWRLAYDIGLAAE